MSARAWTDDEWWERYTPVTPANGDRDSRWLAGLTNGTVTFTSGETAPLEHVWTAVLTDPDCDRDDCPEGIDCPGHGGVGLLAGLHHVNRDGYVVTVEPWESEGEYVDDFWWHE